MADRPRDRGDRSGSPADTPTLTAQGGPLVHSSEPLEDATAATESVSDLDTGPTVIDEERPPTLTGSRGLIVGRYVVLGRLGRGGMGVVYRAYDPELDRRVALKLLRMRKAKPSRVALARERLLREAQALAQLSHPNVVSVYDAGAHGDEVFIAMELIEGATLKKWLRARERSIGEILAVFIQAGKGLAAAHRAGLVHRDFKPGNVMIGEDGNARVLDFGLARAAEIAAASAADSVDSEDESDELAEPDELESAEHRLQAQLTKAGSIMGTPAYMSPEQHLGLEVDELADQFSFCVALYEALYRQRPFSGSGREELKREIVEWRLVEPPENSKVPTWLRRVLERGMAGRAEQRYPSMGALLAELERDRAAPWRRLAVATVAAVLLAFGVIGAIRMTSAERLCRDADTELAAVWDESVKARVGSQFMLSKRPYAAGTFRRASRILDQYRDEWIAMHTEACTATRVRGTQSETLLDRRMQCLSARRGELRALATLFSGDPDGALVDRAVRAALSLTPVAGCADERSLAAAVPLPADATIRSRVAELRARLDRAAAMQRAGRYKSSLELAKAVRKESVRLGYAPLQMEADLRVASLENDLGNPTSAESLFYAAGERAAQTKNDAMLAHVWVELVGIIGHDQARHQEALAMRKIVRAMIVRAGDPPALRATLHGNTATILWSRGRYDEALAEHQHAIAIRKVSLRAGHPDLAVSYNNLANVYYDQGRFAEARRYYEKALPIWETALGVDHPDVSLALMNLGNIAARLRQFDRAKEFHERALVIKTKQLGENHPRLATSLSNMGETLKGSGQWKRALEMQRRALAIWTKSRGPEHPHTAVGMHNVANTLFFMKKFSKAASLDSQALRIFEKSLGNEHLYVAFALTGLGNSLMKLGQSAKAVEHLERALVLREAKKGGLMDLAHTRFSLAQALWTRKRDRKRAIDLAVRARGDYTRLGESGVKKREEVGRWLKPRRSR